MASDPQDQPKNRGERRQAKRAEAIPPKKPPLQTRIGVIDPLRRLRGYVNALNDSRRVISTTVGGKAAYVVPSETHPGVSYDVFQDADERWICTPCPDFKDTGEPCKHIYEVLDRFFEGQIPPPSPEKIAKFFSRARQEWYVDARRLPKVPYVYEDGNAESTREDHSIEEMDDVIKYLLTDLAHVLNRKHPHEGTGRIGMPPGERVLIMVLRRHLGRSMRRFRSEMLRLCADGKIPFPVRRTALTDWNTSPKTTDLLLSVFDEVTKPLMVMEDTVIADSTGFSPFFVSNWRDSNRGEVNLRNGTEWFKEHVVIGRRSKAILGFRITPSRGPGISDDENLRLMLDDLFVRGFDNVQTVIGDNMYLTEENIQYAQDRKINLVGPLKPRNFDSDGLPRRIIMPLLAWIRKHPDLYDELTRARQAVENVFMCQKHDDNHVAAIGSLEERTAQRELIARSRTAETAEEAKDLENQATAASLYISRRNEFLIRVIVQVLRRTAVMMKKYKRPMFAYSKGSVFAPVREYSDAPAAQDDAA